MEELILAPEITMEKKIWKSTKSTMKIAWRD
jgi:hypothetical protein